MSPPSHPLAGEAPASGIIDATYTQRNGAVDLRKLELNLPNSQLQARGDMGAYPLTSPSALNVDFHSSNLGEFDTVLRSLGLKRNGKAGTAALPARSLRPGRLSRNLGRLARQSPHRRKSESHATGHRDALVPPSSPVRSRASRPVRPRLGRGRRQLLSARIAIDHGLLLRGNTKIDVSGAARSARPPPRLASTVGVRIRRRLPAASAP